MAEHGTRACYQRGCSCRPCRLANAAAVAVWRETGPADPWIDANAVQDRLLALAATGCGTPQIAKRAGVSRSVLQAIRSGARTRIRQSDALLVLSIDVDPAQGATTTAWQTKRWLRALLVEGYSKARLAALQGLKSPRLHPHTHRVRRTTEQRFQALYHRLTAEGPG